MLFMGKRQADSGGVDRAPGRNEDPMNIRSASSSLGGERASNNRCRAFALGALAAVIAQAGAIYSMLPLKERIPYFVDVEEATGRVVASDRAAVQFVPEERNIKFHLGRWIEDMYTLDAALTRQHLLPQVGVLMRDKARNQYQAWLDTERPIERLIDKPEITRKVAIRSISFIPGNDRVVMIRFKLVTPNTKDEYRLMTAHYVIAPPASDEEILKNPLGLYITDFNVVSESGVAE